jgi:hypothetical protein
MAAAAAAAGICCTTQCLSLLAERKQREYFEGLCKGVCTAGYGLSVGQGSIQIGVGEQGCKVCQCLVQFSASVSS